MTLQFEENIKRKEYVAFGNINSGTVFHIQGNTDKIYMKLNTLDSTINSCKLLDGDTCKLTADTQCYLLKFNTSQSLIEWS